MTERVVSARLDLEVTDPTTLELQIAVAPLPGADVVDTLSITVDGEPAEVTEFAGSHGTRVHRLPVESGKVLVQYDATVTGLADPAPTTELERAIYLRPSRYAEADKFFGFAATEFGSIEDDADVVTAVADWVGARLSYVPGSSDPIDGAADTLLAGAGVCRDYAHLVVAMLRALNVPARLVAVYAPGCDPMDFHAVVEAMVGDRWLVVDSTALAPRQTLVRIATGRDAADTAFLTNYRGAMTLNSSEVTAVVTEGLPVDDGTEAVVLR